MDTGGTVMDVRGLERGTDSRPKTINSQWEKISHEDTESRGHKKLTMQNKTQNQTKQTKPKPTEQPTNKQKTQNKNKINFGINSGLDSVG